MTKKSEKFIKTIVNVTPKFFHETMLRQQRVLFMPWCDYELKSEKLTNDGCKFVWRWGMKFEGELSREYIVEATQSGLGGLEVRFLMDEPVGNRGMVCIHRATALWIARTFSRTPHTQRFSMPDGRGVTHEHFSVYDGAYISTEQKSMSERIRETVAGVPMPVPWPKEVRDRL